jgi:ribosome recycling factor
MADIILNQLQTEFDAAINHLKNEYSRLQIGRASPGLVEHIQVEAYGSKQPLKALASVSIPDAKTIQIQPWDKGVLSAIEKAIQASDLNISPLNDGICIRLNLPQLTEERRMELSKIVHKLAEETRITIRQHRQKALDKAKEMEKNSEITEDQLHGFEKKLQEKLTDVNHKVEEMANTKEKEVMTV